MPPEGSRRSSERDAAASRSFDRCPAPAGTYVVEVMDPGVVPVSLDVALAAGERRHVALREPAGRSLTVLVHDEFGVPVPFAHVTLSIGDLIGAHRSVAVIEGRTQDMIVHAGLDGRRRVPHAPDGVVHAVATYGTRRGRAEGSGATLTVTLGQE